MRVAFDEQIFLLQRRGGISRYFVELATALERVPGIELIPPSGPVIAPLAADTWGLPLVRSRAGRRLRLALAHRHPRQAKGADLIHRTFYDPAWLRGNEQAPLVITVHDMIPELFPEHVPAGVHLAKRDYVARADLILTNSEQTRSDLIHCYGTPSAPVVVTHLGVDQVFFEAERPAGSALPSRYLIYVGHRSGYKDFNLLLEALPALPADLCLVAVGGGPWSDQEVSRARELEVSQRISRVDMGDRDLARAYAGASALVITSRCEGFGLTVLEAMAAGTPVVAAAAGALPEVGGDAAHYFEAGDSAALATAVSSAIGNEADRRDLIYRGRIRAHQFTWARTAELTAAAYQSIL